MIGIFRLAVIGLVVMTVFYVMIRIYSRSVRREKLENRWEEEGQPGDREAYVEAGMTEYDASLRPKLILLVYIVPTLVVGVLLYIVNYM